MSDDEYTNTPTHLRTFMEEWPDGVTWSIDAADNEGRYTLAVWTHFASLEEALAAAPDFVSTLESEGVRFQWDVLRPKSARRVNQNLEL